MERGTIPPWRTVLEDPRPVRGTAVLQRQAGLPRAQEVLLRPEACAERRQGVLLFRRDDLASDTTLYFIRNNLCMKSKTTLFSEPCAASSGVDEKKATRA